MQHELAAFGLGCRRRDRDLAAELIGRARLALADAFNLGGMQGIDLVAALAVVLETHAMRHRERLGEALPQRLVAGDLAADVADHPAQSDAQEFELAPSALELVGVDIAPDHDCGPLGHPAIALPQLHLVVLGQVHQLFERPVA